MKIKTKIFTSFFITSLLLVSVTMYVSYVFSRDALRDSISSNLETSVGLVAYNIDSLLDGYKQSAEIFAENNIFNVFLGLKNEALSYDDALKEIKRESNELKEKISEIYKIKVLNKDGVVVVSTTESDIGQDRSSRESFLGGKERTYISDLHFSTFINAPGLDISVPIIENDIFYGMVVVDFRSDDIYSVLTRGAADWKTLETYLVNKDTLMISPSIFIDDTFLKQVVNTENSIDCSKYIGESEGRAVIPATDLKNFAVFNDYRGVPVVGSHAYILQMGWCVLSEIDENEVVAIFDKLLMFFVMMGLIVLVIFFIISNIVGETISAPMRKLREGIEIIKEGNLSHKVGVKTKDEIGALSRAFDSITLSIKEARADVSKKVEEQTREIIEKQKWLSEQQDALLNVLEDAKEEKEKSNMLAKDLEKFQLAVDSVSDHIIITDSEGIVLYANKAIEAITGFSVKDVVGKKAGVKKTWGGNMEKKFYTDMWNTIKDKKEIFVGEITNKRKNGEEYEAYISISPILSKEGNVEFFVAIERDITEEKQIEKMKTEFVSVASHQLKTPLTSISWLIEIFKKDKRGNLSKKQKEYLGDIYESSQRMTRLVTDLLNVSRLESGTLGIKPKLIDFSALIRRVTKDHGLIAKPKSCEVVFREPRKKIKPVLLDESLMNQVVYNLVSNAMRYSRAGKCCVSIKLEKREEDCLLSVADNGIGIPKNAQDKIFIKFFRADNAQKMVTDGTGLGLYIAKMIVEMSGGKIWFKSEVDKGSTFYVSIPLEGMKIKKRGKELT